MSGQYGKDLSLRACHVDVAGRWRADSILTEMQELGEDHAAHLGFSRNFLVQNGMCWVLSRLQVNMNSYPQCGEEIRMYTWPGQVQGLYFPRYFRFLAADGRELGGAVTAWVLLGLENRRVLRPNALPGEIPLNDEPAYLPLPGKLAVEGAQPVARRQVAYSDLDFNGHMNNARYAQWICDILDTERLSGQGLSSLQINYIAEGRPGEEITLGLLAQGDGVCITGVKADGKTMFEAQAAYGL